MHGRLPSCLKTGTEVDFLLRPDDIIHDDNSSIQFVLAEKPFQGAEHVYLIRMPSNTHILSRVPSHHNHNVGKSVGITIAPDHLVVFERDDKKDL